ncbi:MAG: hypothetical protein ACYDHH_13080 [Solirubrobacteraceae bacterium]
MSRARARVVVLAGVLLGLGVSPSVAGAHGPVAPVASSYLARVSRVPAGVDAKVVDGDQRMWLHVEPSETVVVLDYRGAPYLRFSGSGVEVNQNSAMYYLNLTPVAETPPSNVTRTTRPSWQRVTDGNDYSWHDGRLHALATVAVSPGVAYVGRWSIPLLVDGRLSSISGGLWHAGDPSVVWFWPIVVLLLCVLAARRVRQPELDALLARVFAVGALIAIATAGLATELHGRPNVSVFQLIELGIIVAFVAWGFSRVLFVPARPGYFFYFVIAFGALWEGVQLIPTLLKGFVLIAAPAFVARASTVLCLGCGVGLLLLGFRIAEQRQSPSRKRAPSGALARGKRA